jgi:hypothetical protein
MSLVVYCHFSKIIMSEIMLCLYNINIVFND